VQGTVDAVDKEKGSVTLKGPKGRTVTLAVKDKSKLDAIAVGDPVVATYIEAVAFQVRKAGSGAPGVSVKEERATSKPGESPAAAVGRQITVTATIDGNTFTDNGKSGVQIEVTGGFNATDNILVQNNVFHGAINISVTNANGESLRVHFVTHAGSTPGTDPNTTPSPQVTTINAEPAEHAENSSSLSLCCDRTASSRCRAPL